VIDPGARAHQLNRWCSSVHVLGAVSCKRYAACIKVKHAV